VRAAADLPRRAGSRNDAAPAHSQRFMTEILMIQRKAHGDPM
jgi:hypothetical protein